MVFNVITLAPNLGPAEREKAEDAAPSFVEGAVDYPALMAKSGWDTVEQLDISDAWQETAQRGLRAYRESAAELQAVLGPDESAERLADRRAKLETISQRLMRRQLFVATAAQTRSLHPSA